MRADTPARSRLSASALAAALLACACATPGAPPAAQVEVQGAGFTITQPLRVGPGVRRDFEDAIGLLERQQYEAAIARLVAVTQAAPQLTAAHIDLAMAYRAANDLPHAEASLQRALALNPHHPVALNELGIVYRRQGRFQDARASYEKALALHPDFRFARKNLAILCDLYLADAPCALENYERYVAAAPDDPSAATWLADLRQRVGR